MSNNYYEKKAYKMEEEAMLQIVYKPGPESGHTMASNCIIKCIYHVPMHLCPFENMPVLRCYVEEAQYIFLNALVDREQPDHPVSQ